MRGLLLIALLPVAAAAEDFKLNSQEYFGRPGISVMVAYGFNRADWSRIPCGSASGTALIRPDFPELKHGPFLWQHTEYVLGRGTTDYLQLALAAHCALNPEPAK